MAIQGTAYCKLFVFFFFLSIRHLCNLLDNENGRFALFHEKNENGPTENKKSAKISKKKNHEQRSRGRLAMITKKKSFEIFTEIPNGKNFLFVLDWASSKMWFVMIGSMDGSARIFLSGSKMKNRKSFEIKIKNYAKSTFFLHEMHQHFHIFQIFCVFFKFP